MSTILERQEQKRQLIALSAEVLAEGLLTFSDRHSDVAAWIDRVLATPEDNLERFYCDLKALQRGGRYIPLAQSGQYADKISDLLLTLKQVSKDPRNGLQALAEFFKSDQVIIERADDSCGEVGDVFRCDGVDLFVHFASQYSEKAWISSLVLDILVEDEYCVRGKLIDEVSRFLAPNEIHLMHEQCKQKAEKEMDRYQRSHWLRLAGSLSKQLAEARA